MSEPVIIDLYAPLSHKAALAGTTTQQGLAPSWVPTTELRRLNAYKIRAAYLANVARFMAGTDTEVVAGTVRTTSLDDRREYGDPALLVDRIIAGVLGDTIEVVVDGADADLPDEPELPPEPEPPAEGATDLQKRIHAARLARWTEAATQIVAEWEQAWTEQPALQARQDWLREWGDDEQLPAKLVEGEGDTCGLGDGVYTLWPVTATKRRPTLAIYDPGFYFPVLTDDTRDFPRKVHLAWEFDETDAKGNTVRWVRRITWELGPITTDVDNTGAARVDNGQFVLRGPISLADGKTLTDRFATAADVAAGVPAGSIVRDYPWNVDADGKPVASAVTCYLTDARWRFGSLDARKVDDFDESNATFADLDGTPVRRLDLFIDFLPVVHVPNTPASREHFGQSTIDLVAQILDDIQIGDTDIQDAAALAAGPVIHSSGQKGTDTLEVRPGTVLNGGENSRMDVLDMSKGLSELRATQDSRLDRLSVNGRVPAEVLGRVDATQTMPGISIALRFGPFTQLIEKLRLTRDPKRALLLKFVQRMAIIGGVLQSPVMPARVTAGSFLPSDQSQLVERVSSLLRAKAISTQTGVAMLVEGGMSIDDARGEVQRIHYEHTEAAKFLADATGSEQLAADFLGVELPQTTRPTVTLPAPPAQ